MKENFQGNVKALVFDLDGTLIDSKRDLVLSVNATLRELEQAGISDKPQAALADAGYWNEQHMDDITSEHGIPVLVRPDSSKRKGERPGWTGGRYSFMRRILTTDHGKQTYRKRQRSIEPVFGHTKHNRKIYRFNYRGRSLVRTEWRLAMLTHNLTKLHRHQLVFRVLS